MNKYKLGQLIEIKHGYAFKSENYIKKSKYALVTLGSISESNDFKFNPNKTTYYGGEFPKEFMLNEGDLVMPLTEQVVGLLGNSAIIPKIENITFVLNQRVGKVNIKNDLLDKTFCHFLLSTENVKQQLEYRASGTKQRNISPKDVYDVIVSIPTIDLQKKIGSLLNNIEKSINLNNKIISELQTMSKEIYDYWFMQYEFSNTDGKPYKSSGGKMVWNEELKREIPEGWEVKKINDIIKFESGSQPPKSEHIAEYKEGYIRFIQNRDYQDNSNLTFIKISGNNKTCDELDIMIDKYGEAGKTRFGILGAYNVALAKINCNDIRQREYIRKFMELESTYNYLKGASMASTRSSLNSNTLDGLKICIPSLEIIDKYTKIAEINIKQYLTLKEENQELIELRDFLLPMLMNGQVKIES